MQYPIWYLNVVPAVEYEWKHPSDACGLTHFEYLLGEMIWLAPRFAEWIDGHLVNDPDPVIAAEHRAFIRKFYDLFAPIAEFEYLVFKDSDSADFKFAVQTYSRIRKLLGIPIRGTRRG
jgi:hypothetical protein